MHSSVKIKKRKHKGLLLKCKKCKLKMTDVYSLWDNVTNYNINNSIDVILYQTSSSSLLTDDENNSTHVFCPSNYNSDPSTLTSVLNVILAILYSIVCLIGVFGNSLVIFVVIRFRWEFVEQKVCVADFWCLKLVSITLWAIIE